MYVGRQHMNLTSLLLLYVHNVQDFGVNNEWFWRAVALFLGGIIVVVGVWLCAC